MKFTIALFVLLLFAGPMFSGQSFSITLTNVIRVSDHEYTGYNGENKIRMFTSGCPVTTHPGEKANFRWKKNDGSITFFPSYDYCDVHKYAVVVSK
jgi:hypothetical protein